MSIPVPGTPVKPVENKCKYWAYATHHLYPSCCGIVEVGSMREGTRPRDEGQPTGWKIGETWEEAWKQMLHQIAEDTRKYNFDHAKFRPLVFNFKRSLGSTNYDAKNLRDLIEAQTFGEAFRVYRWINPNTGNELDQWLLKNNSAEVK